MKINRKALAGLTTISLAALVGPFLVPVPPLYGTHLAQALADADSQFIDLDGLSVHIKTWGQGEPVFVLMHGFSASLYSWWSVMEPFSRLGRVIAYDRPGFGLTERPLAWEGQNPYSPEAQLALLIVLLDHYSLSQAILVSNSAGGTLAMQVALVHPERMKALVLVDPAVYRGGSIPASVLPLLCTPQMRHLGPLIARQLQSRGPQLIKLAWHNPRLLTSETLALYKKPFQVNNWDRALWEFTAATHPLDLSQRLSEITQPVLVVTGDDDRIIPTHQSIRLASELPNARLAIIENAGRVPHEESPAAFIDAVRNFLNIVDQ
jgi:pimeloyl-ACP methyl ester carboxylesterase